MNFCFPFFVFSFYCYESNRKSNNIHFELSNRFSPLYHEGQTLATSNLLPNTIKDCSDKTDKNIMSRNMVRKRPPIIINSFLENQTVFPKKKDCKRRITLQWCC